MMLAFRFFCCLFVVVVSAVARGDGYIRIGSWNIKQLSENSPQNATALAQHIQLAGVDVLALQEIHDTDDDPDTITNSKLDAAFERIKSDTGVTWRYELHPEREGVTRNQHVGVAWVTDKLTMDGTPFQIPVEYANDETWKRTPYAVKFSTADGETDFVVVSLHMKSNTPTPNLPSPKTIRKLEAETLADQLAKIEDHFEAEKDIILIGDTNAKTGSEDAIQVYVDAGFQDLNARNANTYRGFYRGQETLSPFDRILVRKGESEFKYSRQYVLRPADRVGHEQTFSDHWLVMTAFRVQDDDDP